MLSVVMMGYADRPPGTSSQRSVRLRGHVRRILPAKQARSRGCPVPNRWIGQASPPQHRTGPPGPRYARGACIGSAMWEAFTVLGLMEALRNPAMVLPIAHRR